jgi:hypothetical protein
MHATEGKNPVADSLSFFQKLNLCTTNEVNGKFIPTHDIHA